MIYVTDWLLKRRHCKNNWQQAAVKIREKINAAIQDMPAHDGITKLLSGTCKLFLLPALATPLYYAVYSHTFYWLQLLYVFILFSRYQLFPLSENNRNIEGDGGKLQKYIWFLFITADEGKSNLITKLISVDLLYFFCFSSVSIRNIHTCQLCNCQLCNCQLCNCQLCN